LQSQAWLAASRAARWGDAEFAALAVLTRAIEAQTKANADRVLRATPGKAGIVPLIAAGQACGLLLRSAIDVVEFACPIRDSSSAHAALQAAGAVNVAVATPEDSAEYVFDAFRSAIMKYS
jgi:hypothetical protein